MTARRLVVLATTLVVALALAAAAGAAERPRLSESGGSTFPDRAFILSVPPGSNVQPDDIEIAENGQPVDSPRVTVPGGVAGGVGVVLAIDASESMKGAPIQGAIAAARAFAAQRSDELKVGVLLFNGTTTTLLPLTTEAEEIQRALAAPPRLAFGTHIFDAVVAARQMLDDAGVSVASIVLLSDGADVGSTTTRQQAVAAAQQTNTRIFSVGLQSGQFDQDTLARLSSRTGGTFALAEKAADLRKIFGDLGAVLSSEFFISYRSLAGPQQKVFVTARIGDDETAVTSYTSPGITGGAVADSRSIWDRIVDSEWIAGLLSVLIVGLVFLTTMVIVGQRDRSFQKRVLQFTGEATEERAAERRADVNVELKGRPNAAERLRFFHRLGEDAELAGIRTPGPVIMLYVIAGSLALGIGGALLLGSGWFVLLALLGPYIGRWFVSFRLARVRKEFAEQLPETLDVLSSALRAGHSLMGALTVAVEASFEPTRSELGRALADEQLGVPLDDALRVVAHRMENRDLTQIALVARLQREAGTNAAEVLDHVATNVRNEADLQRLVRSLTAQGRMARWIVSLLPVFLFIALFFLNREYLRPLWEEPVGKAALALAAVLIVTGSLIIKKIVDIKA